MRKNQIWASHKWFCRQNPLLRVPLCTFWPEKCTILEVGEVTFRDHKKHTPGHWFYTWSFLRTTTQASLGHQGSTQWNKCGIEWNHPPLLSHYPQCTKRGKEELNSPIKGHQEMSNLREHCYVRQNFPKKYQQCVIQSSDRGDSVFGHPKNLVHHSRERETLCKSSSEVKTFLG